MVLGLCAAGLAGDTSGDDGYAFTYGRAKKLAKLTDPRISESSGLARGRSNPKLFWTHNDSGGAPRLFAFDETGATLGTVVLTGAAAVDWEDMASFSLGRKNFLLVADTGNNDRDRKVCKLYLILEPGIKSRSDHARSAKVVVTLPFTYPEGVQDCEAVAVDAPNERIYLATREDHKNLSRVYALPLARRTPKAPLVAELVAELPHRKVTGMDMSPDGRHAMIISYRRAYEYQRVGEQDWKTAFAQAPRRLSLPKRKQGESVCYGLDGRSLYLTSEKRPTPLWMIPAVEKEPEEGSE